MIGTTELPRSDDFSAMVGADKNNREELET